MVYNRLLELLNPFMSRNIDDLHPLVAQKARAFLDEAKRQGVELLITSTYRDKAAQDALYAKGRTAPGNIVTNAQYPYSYHNHRVAFDVVPMVDGQAVWNDHNLWNRVGLIGKTLGLTWGGDWAMFPDKPHFQYTADLSLDDFIAGKTLPEPESTVSLDVVSDWAKIAWEKAKLRGLIGPNTLAQEKLTKEEFMVFMDRARLLDLPDGETASRPAFVPFESDVSPWAKAAWTKAFVKGVFSENTKPKDLVTKEMVAVFLDRANVL